MRDAYNKELAAFLAQLRKFGLITPATTIVVPNLRAIPVACLAALADTCSKVPVLAKDYPLWKVTEELMAAGDARFGDYKHATEVTRPTHCLVPPPVATCPLHSSSTTAP